MARSYGLASWPRLVLACEVTDAICHDPRRIGQAGHFRRRGRRQRAGRGS
jgi:hypothetical protein